MSTLNKEAFHQFFGKVIAPALRAEEDAIRKVKQVQTEEEPTVSEESE